MSLTPASAPLPTIEVELSISCRSLVGKDALSRTDPMVVVLYQPLGEKRWVELSRTERIKNSHNPDFTKKILWRYRFEEQLPLLFKVFDVHSSSEILAEHGNLGKASCSLAEIVSSGKVQLVLNNCVTGGDYGQIILTAEELAQVKDNVVLQFRGKKLDKKKFLGKSDPFLVIMKAMESGDFNAVYRSDVLMLTVNPEWKKFSIPVRLLCNGDPERTIKVICYDWEEYGEHSLIGEFETSLKDLAEGPSPNNTYQLINKKKQEKKNGSYKNSGTISLVYYHLQKKYSFLDYIKGGTQIHCTFAIDFTASNGQPTSPDSPHFISPVPNAYEIAIQSVGNIIKDYDSDQLFPVLGFGARIPPSGQVSHEFFVNLRSDTPYCQGIEGVLDAYRMCIQQVQLYGPSKFSPVINHVANFAMTFRDGSNYFILLILTDGVITDMSETIQAITAASSLPMSIIIVGVGPADFEEMEALGRDGSPLTASKGDEAVRDIVQFITLRNFLKPEIDPQLVMGSLAKEVLAKVPKQFLSYMEANHVIPKPVDPNAQPISLPPDPELLLME